MRWRARARNAEGKVVWSKEGHNLIFVEGIEVVAAALGPVAAAEQKDFTQSARIALVSSSSFSGFDEGDTYASHPNWSYVDFSGQNKAWSSSTSGGTCTSNSPTAYIFTAETGVRGSVVYSEYDTNFGGTTIEFLWAVIDFGETVTMQDGGTLEIEYTTTVAEEP